MIHGKWHVQGCAAYCNATLTITDEKYCVLLLEDGTTYKSELSAVLVSERLGNVARKITLENGSVFTSRDNDAIDTVFNCTKRASHLVHTLESSMRWVFVALLITVLISYAFFTWGVPWTSKHIAQALPHKANQLIASSTLDFLDRFIFDKSNIDSSKMQMIQKHFESLIVPLSQEGNEITYKLHFRLWKTDDLSIPNALALPSGDIILTDKFVELSENQDEIDAILLHEIGHVIHRHTLTMIIERTFVTVAVMMIAGDINELADLGVGLGSLLVSSGYSREHESEADLYAFQQMLNAKIDPVSFSNILNRMTQYIENSGDNRKQNNNTNEVEGSVLNYISSHPSTTKRVEIAQQFGECFKQGLSTCHITR